MFDCSYIVFLSSQKTSGWDEDALYQYDPTYSAVNMGGGNAHIAVNPVYPELLLVTDHIRKILFTFNVTDGGLF